MILIFISQAVAGVAEGADPVGFATDGQVGLDADLISPGRITKAEGSGWLGFGAVNGFDAHAVGRFQTLRLFVGWEHAGQDSNSEVKGVKDSSSLTSVDDGLVFGFGARGGAFSGSLTGTFRSGIDTLTGSGAIGTGASQTEEDYEENGAVQSTNLSGQLRGEWSKGDGETRPRVGVLLGYANQGSMVDYRWEAEDSSGSYDGEFSAVSSGSTIGASSSSSWTFQGGVRGGVEMGGTRDDPKTSLWAQLAGGAGGAAIPESSITYKSDGDTLKYELDASELHHELFNAGLGGYHRLGGPENSFWLGGRLALGWDWEDGADKWNAGSDKGTSAYNKSTVLSGALSVPLAARVAASPTVRVWAGATPTLSFTSGEVESHPAESDADTDTTTTTDTGPGPNGDAVRTTRGSSIGTSVDGRLGIEWHHESGVFAAVGLQMSTNDGGIGDADGRIWFGWAPE